MDRKAQIEEAAFKAGINHTSDSYDERSFAIGAEWADANPPPHSVQICTEINQKLEKRVLELEDALKVYADEGNWSSNYFMKEIRYRLFRNEDPPLKSTPYKTARKALAGESE